MKEYDYPFPQGKNHNSFCLLKKWWSDICEKNEVYAVNSKNYRGERASLKRATTLTEIILTPGFHRLLNQLGRDKIPPSRYDKLAIIAALVARLEKDTEERLGARMGNPGASPGKPALSELRMRRLLACDDLDELFILLRRALAVLDYTANINDLATTIWHWTALDEKSPYDPRRQLAFDYYAHAPLPPMREAS